MINVQLKAYKVKELVFHNNVQSKVQLKLSNKVSHNVKYTKNGFCEAVLQVEVFDKQNPDVLNVKASVSGIFEIKSAVEKEFLHVETFKELFPYAKALVTTVSANAGIQPIIVQNVDIENQEIYRFEMSPKPNDNGEEKQ